MLFGCILQSVGWLVCGEFSIAVISVNISVPYRKLMLGELTLVALMVVLC